MSDKDIFFGTLDEMFGPPIGRTEGRMVMPGPNLQQFPRDRPMDPKAREELDLEIRRRQQQLIGIDFDDLELKMIAKPVAVGRSTYSTFFDGPLGQPFDPNVVFTKARQVGWHRTTQLMGRALAGHRVAGLSPAFAAPYGPPALDGRRRTKISAAVRSALEHWASANPTWRK